VVTTSASCIKETFEFLEKTVIHWGAFPCGSINRTVRNLKKPVEHKEYDNFVKHLFMSKSAYSPKLNQLAFFQVQKVLAFNEVVFETCDIEPFEFSLKFYFNVLNV
jgi:hypothetical protein